MNRIIIPSNFRNEDILKEREDGKLATAMNQEVITDSNTIKETTKKQYY